MLVSGLLGDSICAALLSDLPVFSCCRTALTSIAGTARCRTRVITAEALRTEVAVGPALVALFGLLFLCISDAVAARAVAGRAEEPGLLRPAGRPNERRDKAALTGLCPSPWRVAPADAALTLAGSPFLPGSIPTVR